MPHGSATMVAPRARSKLSSACSSVIVDRVLANQVVMSRSATGEEVLMAPTHAKFEIQGQDHN
jgi:hypothetical protein